MTASRPPRFRFRLRTLFVLVTLSALFCGLRFAWKPAWVRGRPEFLAEMEERRRLAIEMDLVEIYAPAVFKPIAPIEGTWWQQAAQDATLWFYNEPKMGGITVVVGFVGPGPAGDVFERAQRHFPEAWLVLEPSREMVPATVEIAEDAAAP